MRSEWLGIAALVIVLPALLLYAGARTRWFVYGILSWAIALVLKAIGLVLLYVAYETGRMPPATCAAAHGVLSAVSELGSAFIFLRNKRLPLLDVLAFGTGIGSFEVLWVLAEGSVELAENNALTWVTFLAMANVPLLIERAVTVVGHISSRLLVYASLSQRKLLPGLLALVFFALVDGTAAYGVLSHWDWSDPLIQTRFELFLVAVGAVEVMAAWYFAKSIK